MIKLKENYARLLITTALNLKCNAKLAIVAPIEAKDFIEILINLADKHQINTIDVAYLEETNQTEAFKESYFQKLLTQIKNDYYFLTLTAGSSSQKTIELNETQKQQIKQAKYHNPVISSKAVIPTISWAKSIFPNLADKQALEKLWLILAEITFSDQTNPEAIWQEITTNTLKRREYLNSQQFEELRIKTNTSDFSCRLINNHVWHGGCDTLNNITFLPNFPTEEVFNTIDKYSLNGVVTSTKPLFYNGQLIADFTLTFKEGKVISCQAKEGLEALKDLLKQENMSYVGEIALLAGNTICGKPMIVFNHTLLDENVAAHLALGCAYTCNVKEGIPLEKAAFESSGINFANSHIDFMFGDYSLEVIAIKNNKSYPIIQAGNWVIEK